MHVHLQSHMHVSLQQLLLAFPLSVSAAHGRLVLRRRGYERLLLPLASDGKTIDRILGCSYPMAERESVTPP